jgi:hypothetical protein
MIQFFWDGLLNSEDEGSTKGREHFFQRYGVTSQRNSNLHRRCESLKSGVPAGHNSSEIALAPEKKSFIISTVSLAA